MVEKLMNGMLTFAAKLSNQRHLGAIRNAFTMLLPVQDRSCRFQIPQRWQMYCRDRDL